MRTRLCVGVTALAVAVFAGSWLLGDDKKPDEKDPPKVKGQLPSHYKKLGLSEKQIQEIYRVQAGYRDKIEVLQQQIDDLKKAEHTDVENVLTDPQKALLKSLLIGDVADADKDKDKPAATDKDKPAPADKDKPATTDKDKAPPAKDKPATTDK